MRQIIRPAELEAPALGEAIHKQALFGTPRIFDGSEGVSRDVEGDALVLAQERGSRVQIDEREQVRFKR